VLCDEYGYCAEDDREKGAVCHYTVGGVDSKNIIEFFRILRVAVVRSPTAGALSSTHAHHVLPVVYRSFAPQLLPVAADEDGDVRAGTESGSTSRCTGQRRRRPESMKETFARVIVELLNTGTYSI